jgi:hypothetical protein
LDFEVGWKSLCLGDTFQEELKAHHFEEKKDEKKRRRGRRRKAPPGGKYVSSFFPSSFFLLLLAQTSGQLVATRLQPGQQNSKRKLLALSSVSFL